MISMLRTQIEKVDNMQRQTANVSREVETLNQKEKLQIRHTATKMKTASDGLICSLDTAKERISKPEDMPFQTENSNLKSKKKKEQKSRTISEDCEIISEGVINTWLVYQKEKKEERRNI